MFETQDKFSRQDLFELLSEKYFKGRQTPLNLAR